MSAQIRGLSAPSAGKFRTIIFEGEFQNEGISQRHDTHITYNGFVDLRVERLCLAATDLERLKAVLFTACEIETMVLDLVAVATDDKGTVPFFVAGQIGTCLEFLRVLPVGRAGHEPALHLFGDDLRLSLSRCR